MWMTFFKICDFLCNFIPSARRREHMRRVQLYDWRRKYMALRRAFPNLNFKHTKMIKGGWNVGFIVDNKYVFKIRKQFDNQKTPARILREKRITDAFEHISPIQIPKIKIVEADGFTFFRYNFMPGKNLNTCRLKKIVKHRDALATQLAEFINAMHNARPMEIDDLRGDVAGDGWNHHDICNNIIVNPRTMKIVGLIDWEYSGWGPLQTEFKNIDAFSEKMRDSGIRDAVVKKYNKLQAQK